MVMIPPAQIAGQARQMFWMDRADSLSSRRPAAIKSLRNYPERGRTSQSLH